MHDAFSWVDSTVNGNIPYVGCIYKVEVFLTVVMYVKSAGEIIPGPAQQL